VTRDVSTVILDALAEVGVTHIYGLPGDAINGLVDATRRHASIEFVTVRHEEAGAFAACAQAKLTGTIGVVAGTAGPGAIHLLNGLYDAKLDQAPMLAITGQVESPLIGGASHQEIDLQALFEDVSVFSETIVDVGQMPRMAHDAIREALTQRGVSHLVVPSNMALAKVPDAGGNLLLPPATVPAPDPDALEEASRLLNRAQAPTILLGIGARKAVDDVLALAETLGSPIIKTLRAKDLIPDDHPLVVGGLGLLGTSASVAAMDRTDVLLMVGTDFPYLDFYPEKAKVVQVDIEASHIGRRTEVDVPVVADAELAIADLLERVDRNDDRDHLETARADADDWARTMAKAEEDDAVPIRPQRLARSIREHCPRGSVFVVDTGAVTVWAARHLPVETGDRFILSAGLASMAFALPGAIGAKIAFPERNVVALTGDGGFSMLIGDLITAVDLELALTVVVFNNSRLGLIKMEQEEEGLPEFATQLRNPDFAQVARAMGAEGWRVENPADLSGALAGAIASPRPSVVDVVVNPGEITMPPKIEPGYVYRYAKAKVKEIIGKDDVAEPMEDIKDAMRQTIERVTG
jgi:pyruvate oxidase